MHGITAAFAFWCVRVSIALYSTTSTSVLRISQFPEASGGYAIERNWAHNLLYSGSHSSQKRRLCYRAQVQAPVLHALLVVWSSELLTRAEQLVSPCTNKDHTSLVWPSRVRSHAQVFGTPYFDRVVAGAADQLVARAQNNIAPRPSISISGLWVGIWWC
jgi:hypothetical protein